MRNSKKIASVCLAVAMIFSLIAGMGLVASAELAPIGEGLFAVDNNYGAYGYIDKNGTVVIQLEYDNAGSFSEGLACVRKGDNWGYIDQSGAVVISFTYDYADSFSEGLAVVRNSSYNWGAIDRTGAVVIPFEYNSVLPFSEGLAAVENDDGQWGFIDKTGAVVIPFDYGYALSFSEGLAAVLTDDGYCYIDKTGNVMISFDYTAIPFSFSEGLAHVYNDEVECTGFIDKTGAVVIPFEHYGPEPFSEGLSREYAFNGRYGFIDKTGDFVISREYASALDFSEGLAAVSNNDGKWGYIDKTGKVVIPMIYDDAGSFKEGYAIGMVDGGYVVLTNPLPHIATPTTSTVLVNGKQVAFDAYNIGGNNYFKLRDLAYVLNGTEKQFSVAWDGASNAITLASGSAYAAVGGEMTGKGDGEKSAKPTTSKILKDGSAADFTAYNIQDNNYFKLRDIGEAFDFAVEWDGVNKVISIDTSKGYTPEA